MYGIFAIVGAGGYGREVIPLVQQVVLSTVGVVNYKIVFVVEGGGECSAISGYDVLTPEEFFSFPADKRFFNVAIADSYTRKRIAEDFTSRGAVPFSISSTNSLLFESSSISEGAIFSPFTTVTADARIGKFFHANLYSYVAHDCIIGDYVTFAPGVKCNGNVIIEDHVYVGTGAIIKQGTPKRPMVIGAGSIIGMGAVVTKSVPEGITVFGNPAKPLNSRVIKKNEN